jgi:methionyl-tRNA formyltransferase
MFVAAFGEILSEDVLAVPRLGALNLHASLLPHYRGAAPIQRALMAGDTETGVTVQWMDAELDAGDILLQRALSVLPGETFGSLHDRLADEGARLAVESVSLIRRGKAPRTPQNDQAATYAPPIRKAELYLDWTAPSASLAHRVRALSPQPGARTSHRGRLLKVLQVEQDNNVCRGAGTPGEVGELTNRGFWVRTGEGRLLLLRLQPAGSRAMSAPDYARGYHVQLGERLE